MPVRDGRRPEYDHEVAVARKVIDRGSAVPSIAGPSADEAA